MNNIFFADDIIGLTGSSFFLSYLFLFLFGSMLGYGIEVLFRRVFSAHKWVNPGFMKGPWLPLYGFGLILMFTFCWVLIVFLPEDFVFYNPQGNLFGTERPVSGPTVFDLIPISIMWLSLIALEFLAGLIFVRGFKVRLWDYRNMKGNILGIICPVFDVVWLAVALLFYYAIDPFVYEFYVDVCAFLFGRADGSQAAHFGSIFILGLAYGVLLIDFIQSIGIFSKITSWAKKNNITVRYEKMVNEQKEKLALKKKAFLASLPKPVKNTLDDLETSSMKSSGKWMTKLKKMVLIDPKTEISPEENYDKKGRPIKDDEQKDR